MANLFEPVTRTVAKLGEGFSNLANVASSVFPSLGTLITAALLGPIGLIISNWDRLVAYFNNKVPAMFYTMAGAAREGMAAVLSIFSDGFTKLVEIAGRAINAIIDALNFMGSKVNQAFNAFGSALGLGATELVGKIAPIKVEFDGLNNTIVGMQVAAKDNFAKAGQYAQKYATDLRTIARTTAEANSQAEAGSAPWQNLADKLKDVADNAGDGSGGGKGGKGGAAKNLKKAGEAAKKAGKDMKDAQSDVEEFGQAMQSIAQSIGSGVVDALFSIAEGTKSAKEAFTELAKSILKQVANMIVQLLILKPLMGMFGGGLGGIGGGLLGGLGRSAGGVTRSLGAAPRIAPGAQITRSGTMGNYGGFAAPAHMNGSGGVTVNNYSNANVKTRQDNGQITIDIIEEVVADRLTRGGNRIDQAMSRAYGARRVGY
jgi:hypothetical protein